jgi:hypothetical protein
MDHQSTGLLIHVASQQEKRHRQGELRDFISLPDRQRADPWPA